MEGVELRVREDARCAVAAKALQRKTGARGLRTILENVLLDIMYELPSLDDVAKVVVDEHVIDGSSSQHRPSSDAAGSGTSAGAAGPGERH